MIYSFKKHYFLPVFVMILIVLLIVLNALITPKLSIKTMSEIFPKEKWLLTKGNNGQIISSMIDYTKGHTVQYSLNQFERGEYVSLKFLLDKTKYVNVGDTIISISSSEVDERMITAENDFEIAKANLKAKDSGEKEALIEEARARLAYTEEKLNEEKVMFERIKGLYDKGLSSQQEYDSQKWIIDLLGIERKIYSAQIDNLSTGAKAEEVNLLLAEISSAEAKLKFMKNRKNDLKIISPISGYIENIFSPDTLSAIVNTNEVVLHTPVTVEDMEYLKIGEEVNFNLADYENELSGKVIAVSHEVKFINNKQAVFVSILLDNKDGKFLPGMVRESYLNIKTISVFEYIKRLLTA